jgi:hypothetical protein
MWTPMPIVIVILRRSEQWFANFGVLACIGMEDNSRLMGSLDNRVNEPELDDVHGYRE